MPSRNVWAKLDDHQRYAVEFALKIKTCALLCEQRTGKTYITGGVIEKLADSSFNALLIVPLTNIESTWATFLGRELAVSVARSLEQFDILAAPKLLLLHYEAVPKLLKALRKRPWALIVYDESHRLKARATLQSRTAAKLSMSSQRKLILTGTPLNEKPNDLWAQFRFLKPSVFGTRWKDYEDTFLEDMPAALAKELWKLRKRKRSLDPWLQMELRIFKRKRKFRDDMLPEFIRRVSPYVVRIYKSDVGIAAPEIIWEPVKLRGKQRILYETIERDLVAKIGDSRITTPMRVTQIGKLQQICGGFVFDDEGEIQEVGRAKMRQVLSLVKAYEKPIVIFCRYLEEIYSLAEELSDYRVETFTGKTKKAHRAEVLEKFQSGEIDILVAQERTGGVGVDLFAADTAIFFSLTYSFIDFDQSLSRIQVRGISNIKKIILIFAQDTIDELIYSAVLSRRQATEVVLSKLRRKEYGD